MIVAQFSCKTCGVELYLDDERTTMRGKMIPIDSRTNDPHPRHMSMADVIRGIPRIEFGEAYGRRCYICNQFYSATYSDCPDCYTNVECGYPVLKTDRCFLSPLVSDRALVKWAYENGEKIPIRFIKYLRN